jgi:CheY-like chemotaxis protein
MGTGGPTRDNYRKHGTSTKAGVVRRPSIEGLLPELVWPGPSDRFDTAYRLGSVVSEFLSDHPEIRGAHELWAALGEGPGLQVSRTDLIRALRVFELGRRHPHLLEFSDLTPSHLFTVTSLAAPEQVRLLHQARERRMTVRQLRQAVGHASRAVTGRPKTPPVIRTLRALFASPGAFDGVDSLLALEPARAAELLSTCERVRDEIERVATALQYAAFEHRPRRVLFVDGNPKFSRRAQRILKKSSYLITVANSAAEALHRLDPRMVCAIIELSLPDGSGYELAHELTRRQPALRCVFMTSHPPPVGPKFPPGLEEVVPKGSGLVHIRQALARTVKSI